MAKKSTFSGPEPYSFQGVHWLNKHPGVLHQLGLSLQASQHPISFSWALLSEIFFWLLWDYCQSMIVKNFSFFRDDVAIHEKEELTRLSEVFRFSFLLTFFFIFAFIFHELIWFSMFSNFVETSFVALPRPPTNLRVESAQHNMIKVRLKYGQVWSSYVSNILHWSRQLKQLPPT